MADSTTSSPQGQASVAHLICDGTLLSLLREALVQDGQFRWRLRGNSMAPTLPPDCEILIVPLPDQLRPGDVVVFSAGNTLIVHRLVRRSGGCWIAQGDGRRAPDPPLTTDQILGLVSSAHRDGRCIWPGRWRRLSGLLWVSRHHLLRPLRAAWMLAKAQFL